MLPNDGEGWNALEGLDLHPLFSKGFRNSWERSQSIAEWWGEGFLTFFNSFSVRIERPELLGNLKARGEGFSGGVTLTTRL